MLCEIPKDRLDKDGCLPLSSVDDLALDGCEIPEGVCFTVTEARTVKKEARMEPKDVVAPEPAAQTQAIVAVPPAQTDPSSQLMALAGKKDVSPMALGAGVVAVVAGSGFLWKQIKDMIQGKREHELEMKKMESEKKEGGCSAQHAAVAAQVQALQGQMGAIPEQTNAAFKAVGERIDGLELKLEALGRKLAAASKKKAGAK
jgi:hypothetical protein